MKFEEARALVRGDLRFFYLVSGAERARNYLAPLNENWLWQLSQASNPGRLWFGLVTVRATSLWQAAHSPTIP